MHYKNNKPDNSASACQDALTTNNARRRVLLIYTQVEQIFKETKTYSFA